MPNTFSCYVLLDDCTALIEARSRLYTDFVQELVCTDATRFDIFFVNVEAQIAAGLHAVLMCDYGFGLQLQGLADGASAQIIQPAAREASGLHILLFRTMARLTASEVEAWLSKEASQACASKLDAPTAGIFQRQARITGEQYAAAIAAIHAHLAAGDCYQINYTWPLDFAVFGAPLSLYRRLRTRQPTAFCALIQKTNGLAVLSFSPELFIEYLQGRLRARPMKGTAVRDAADRKKPIDAAAVLAADPKNRAENLMIVDLLRNDLGRIAETGSVTVPQLFSIESHGDLLQMTSTVEATPRASARRADIFRALFPCGSITGAPKHRAMQLIERIEAAPRGLYTGAIGWLDAPNNSASLGDFCWSVAIRTLQIEAPEVRPDAKLDAELSAEPGTSRQTALGLPLRKGCMGVGGGIVIDSQAEMEYQECWLKAGFLTGLDPGFELFETMHATQREGCRHLNLHLARLQESASSFGFTYDEAAVHEALQRAIKALPEGPHRLRLSLAHSGSIDVRTAPIGAMAGPVKLLLSMRATEASDLFLQHKTTLRQDYDAAWQAAEAQGAFDMLFFNQRGELTEGARSNVFVLRHGVWHTPPLACGVLSGVMRALLLNDPAWNTCESILTHADLLNAENLMVCNALRGALPAFLSR